MAILTGRYGRIAVDLNNASPAVPIPIASLNAFTLSLKQDFEDVSCFLDLNKVYVPGLRDISGTVGGFWNSADMTVINMTNLPTPATLDLQPNQNEGFAFQGLAYMDADINCSLAAPKITGNFRAAGPWALP